MVETPQSFGQHQGITKPAQNNKVEGRTREVYKINYYAKLSYAIYSSINKTINAKSSNKQTKRLVFYTTTIHLFNSLFLFLPHAPCLSRRSSHQNIHRRSHQIYIHESSRSSCSHPSCSRNHEYHEYHASCVVPLCLCIVECYSSGRDSEAAKHSCGTARGLGRLNHSDRQTDGRPDGFV